MRKTVTLLALAGMVFSAYGQTVAEANRVIVHHTNGTVETYRFNELDYIEFDNLNPAVTLEVVEGSLTDNSVSVKVTPNADCDHFSFYYAQEAQNTPVTEHGNTVNVTENLTGETVIPVNGLTPETEYIFYAEAYDKYGLHELSEAISLTTLAEPVMAEPKVGDYFYSDGTWSDGGLISINPDGTNAVWSDTDMLPLPGKTVIGIVCCTDQSRIAPEDKADGYTHGYVISTRNIVDKGKPNYSMYPETVWYGAKYSEGDETQVVKLTKSAYQRLSGRQDSQQVLEKHVGNEAVECPMFYHAANTLAAAPESTSGWFIPSAGQLWDCIANFCSGVVAQTLKENRTNGYDFTYYFTQTLGVNVFEQFMKPFSRVPAGDKDEITMNDVEGSQAAVSMRTSNRYDTEATIIFNLGSNDAGLFEGMAAWRDEEAHARAFLAF